MPPPLKAMDESLDFSLSWFSFVYNVEKSYGDIFGMLFYVGYMLYIIIERHV